MAFYASLFPLLLALTVHSSFYSLFQISLNY